ncbi:MAG: hypothetical protein ACI8QW_001109, partial [Saprospiraceae bacterium]
DLIATFIFSITAFLFTRVKLRFDHIDQSE